MGKKIMTNRASLKKMLFCCLPTQKIRGGSVGRLFFLLLIVEVGGSVGYSLFSFFIYIDLCMASTES